MTRVHHSEIWRQYVKSLYCFRERAMVGANFLLRVIRRRRPVVSKNSVEMRIA
jgi:hypothetical protein